MLELGAAGPALHDEIARLALAGPAQIIAGVGEFARALTRAAPERSAGRRPPAMRSKYGRWSRRGSSPML
jgi:UDP-N-acetylmuramyl pentapeptide synthase